MTKVVIDRSKWSRGDQAMNALLVTEGLVLKLKDSYDDGPVPVVGTMCCLGFASLVCGATTEQIAGKQMPAECGIYLKGLVHDDSEEPYTQPMVGDIMDLGWADEAARINDDKEINDVDREIQLTELAAENGFEFTFIN